MLNELSFQKCEDTAQQMISDFKIIEPAVDIFGIVKGMSIELLEYNLGDDTSGVLVIQNGKGIIGFNPKEAQVRRRFTVAHELGHFLLHRTTNDLFVDNFFLMKFRKNNAYTEEDYRHEQEANAFAAALLMPETFLEEEMKKMEYQRLSEADFIGRLARKFEVSIPAMTYRLTNLNIF
ncbi:ImmA/IrrE family metallo-endopeptidase [Flavitalea flava]